MPPVRVNPKSKTHVRVERSSKGRSTLSPEEKKHRKRLAWLKAQLAEMLPKKERRDRDAYLTDPRYCLAICRRLSRLIPAPNRIVEPSAGTGNFIRAAKQVWPEALVMAVDIHPEHHRDLALAGAATYLTGDWMKQDVRQFRPDLDLGNPPFSQAEPHTNHALDMLEQGKHLAFLLPVSFMTTQGRARNLFKNPPPDPKDPSTWVRDDAWGGLKYIIPLAERPSYTEDGHTDMAEYAVYVWEKGFIGFPTTLPHLWRAEADCIETTATTVSVEPEAPYVDDDPLQPGQEEVIL